MKTVKPGIRRKPNGKFVATKSIDGQRHYKEFNTLREAEIWKNKFHPLAHKEVTQKFISPTRSSANEFVNGRDESITVKEVYEKYLKGPLKSLGKYQQYYKPNRMNRFLAPIFSVRMADLTPEVIAELLNQATMDADTTYGRIDFREELKDFKTILNWYRNEKDFTFILPITKYHYKISEVRPRQKKKKDLSPEDLVKFIDNLPDLYRPLATLQFTYGLRIGEVCALTTDTVNFKERKIYIRQALVWLKDVPSLKRETKTEDEAELRMTDTAELILRELEKKRPSGCRFIFNLDGKMLRYRPLYEAYKKALLDSGITGISGTHFIRHSAATISRKFGGIDAAQALLRHKSSKMAEHYARLDVGEKSSEVVIHAEKVFLEARRATIATKPEETLTSSAN